LVAHFDIVFGILTMTGRPSYRLGDRRRRIMEETPEEVLARLQRRVDSMKARGQVVPTSSVSSKARAADEPRRVDVITEDPPDLRFSFSTVSRTIAGQVICVATCAVTILLWINLSHTITYIVALIAALLFAIGLVRRVPFAAWGLVGLVLGLVLGRFS
jgi:Flp pilus assembly protein TadB